MIEKSYDYICTRSNESLDSIMKWYKGEQLVGIHDSIFICENGVMSQYVDNEEGQQFHEYVKGLTLIQFRQIYRDFYDAIYNKDLLQMHKGLAVFDEMDNYNLGNERMREMLKTIRENTESVSYGFKIKKSPRNFILFKGRVYFPEK